MLDAMRELGVGLVPYSPLGRGFLTGTVDVAALDAEGLPRQQPALRRRGRRRPTRPSPTRCATVADGQGRRPGADRAGLGATRQGERLGVPLAPIPGTKRVKWLEQNVAALDITLTDDELAVLDPLGGQVVGARY